MNESKLGSTMQDTNPSGLAKLFAIIEAINIGMLTTEDENGHLRSRPMATQQADNTGVYFFTAANSPKVDEIADDATVNVSYSDPSTQTYVSVSGIASTSKDAKMIKQLWTEEARRWFPGGPNDQSIALLKIAIREAEYWDVDTKAMKRLQAQHADGAKIAAATDHQKLS